MGRGATGAISFEAQDNGDVQTNIGAVLHGYGEVRDCPYP